MNSFLARWTPQSYGLVDDARGVWEDHGIQDTLLPSGRRNRASAASLAIGQMQRLPSARAIDWRVTADLRHQLGEPLARFRAAMGKLAASDSPNPLDQAFDDFIETIWMTEVAPALAELEDLSRQGQLREVFFDDVSGKLTTYAGPAIALIGGSIAWCTSLRAGSTGGDWSSPGQHVCAANAKTHHEVSGFLLPACN